MKRVIYFFSEWFNLLFVIVSVFVLLDMKYNFLNKQPEDFIQKAFDVFLGYVGIVIWIGAFISLIVLSTKSYNNKDK